VRPHLAIQPFPSSVPAIEQLSFTPCPPDVFPSPTIISGTDFHGRRAITFAFDSNLSGGNIFAALREQREIAASNQNV
jgi:hypothetical protein